MKLQFEDNDYYLMDDNNTIATTDKIMLKVDGSIKKLSKENCDEIFGTLSIEENALGKASHFGGVYRNPEGFSDEQIGYLHGFIEGAELNKDKLFTVEDMHRAIELAREFKFDRDEMDYTTVNFTETNIIQSLKQPTEIEVEIRCYIGNGDKESDSFNDPLVTNTGIPKLDTNGCLILKKL